MSLKDLRVKRKLDQGIVADLCGVDRITVWRWEHGLNTPQHRFVRYLSITLSASEEEIEAAIAESRKEAKNNE